MRNAVVLFMVVVLCGIGSAAIPLVNAGFEWYDSSLGPIPEGTNRAPFPYWPSVGGLGIRNPDPNDWYYPPTAVEGEYYANFHTGGTIWQTTGNTIVDNALYTLRFAIATMDTGQGNPNSFAWFKARFNEAPADPNQNQVGDSVSPEWYQGNGSSPYIPATPSVLDWYDYEFVWDSSGSSAVGKTLQVWFQGDLVMLDDVSLSFVVPRDQDINLTGNLLNADFETPVLTEGQTAQSVEGWTEWLLYGPPFYPLTVYPDDSETFPFLAATGNQCVQIIGNTITQLPAAATIQPNTTYVLNAKVLVSSQEPNKELAWSRISLKATESDVFLASWGGLPPQTYIDPNEYDTWYDIEVQWSSDGSPYVGESLAVVLDGDRHFVDDFHLTASGVPTSLTVGVASGLEAVISPRVGTFAVGDGWDISLRTSEKATDCPDVYAFNEWSSTGGAIDDESERITSVTIDGPTAVTAHYAATPDAPVCGDLCHSIPTGDFDENCIVNLLDFVEIAAAWLDTPTIVPAVYNYSFEEPSLADGGVVTYTGGDKVPPSNPPYWLSAGTTQVLHQNHQSTDGLQATDGSQYVYIFSGGVLQQGAWFIQPDTVYTIAVDLATVTALSPEYAWSWVGLYVVPDGQPLTALNVEKFGWNSLGTLNLNTEIPTGQFGTFSVSWDSTGSPYVGEILYLRLQSDRVYYDNVRFVHRLADMTGDGNVNIDDLLEFAEYWLDDTRP